MITREQIEKTTAEWEAQNPTLAADVIGIEVMATGYLRYKRGNGTDAWLVLPYLDKIPFDVEEINTTVSRVENIERNYVSDETLAGILSEYVTDDDIDSVYLSLKTEIDQNAEDIALRATKEYVAESLNGYVTEAKLSAELKISSDGVLSTVSKSYATTDAVNKTLSDNYYAKSTIDQKFDSITLSLVNYDGTETSLKLTNGTLDLSFLKGEVDDAKKYATNFISMGSDGGIEVGNKSGDDWTGYRSQMLADSFNIVDENGNILAQYGANDVHLGLNNDNSAVHFCNDKAVLQYDSNNGWVGLKADDVALVTTGYNDTYAHLNVYKQGDYGSGISLRAENGTVTDADWFYSGIDIENTMVSINAEDNVFITSPNLTVNSPATSFAGATSTTGGVYVGGNLFQKNGDGEDIAVLTMLNSRADISLGYGGYSAGVGDTYVMAGEHLYFRSGTDAMVFYPCYKNDPAPHSVVIGDAGDKHPTIHPNATGGYGYLGTISYKWAAVYATNGSIQTSDRRLKRNISDDYAKYEKMILSLRPVSFDFIDIDDGIERTGFIAQEVLDVLNDCGIDADKTLFVINDKVDPDSDLGKMINDDHVLGMNYEQFIVPTIAVVQSLVKRIEDLESRIA